MSQSEPDASELDATFHSLEAMREVLRERNKIYFAIDEFDRAVSVLEGYLENRVGGHLDDLPVQPDGTPAKLAEDIIMAQEIALSTRVRADLLIGLVRKLIAPGSSPKGA